MTKLKAQFSTSVPLRHLKKSTIGSQCHGDMWQHSTYLAIIGYWTAG